MRPGGPGEALGAESLIGARRGSAPGRALANPARKGRHTHDVQSRASSRLAADPRSPPAPSPCPCAPLAHPRIGSSPSPTPEGTGQRPAPGPQQLPHVASVADQSTPSSASTCPRRVGVLEIRNSRSYRNACTLSHARTDQPPQASNCPIPGRSHTVPVRRHPAHPPARRAAASLRPPSPCSPPHPEPQPPARPQAMRHAPERAGVEQQPIKPGAVRRGAAREVRRAHAVHQGEPDEGLVTRPEPTARALTSRPSLPGR